MLPDDRAAELHRRATRLLSDERLRVDYYRIRRSLSYPLPVRGFHVADLPLRGFPSADYPWSIWLAWALEERIHAIGHVADASGDPAMRSAAVRDLQALAAWPAFRQLGKPDLCLGHCMRTLWTAWRAWPWLGEGLRQELAAAFARAVADVLPLSDALHGQLQGSADVLDRAEPHALLHNIPIIGTVGAALAARAIGHPARAELDRRLGILFAALLGARRLGIHEAAAYDGYVLDFMADWLAVLPVAERAPFLDHPRLADFLAQSRLLAAPGDAAAVCEIGDVEPEHMPFHLSAQVKLQALRWDAVRAGWLARLPSGALRSDALDILHQLPGPPAGTRGSGAGGHDVHYAAVLRSGDDAEDLAVAMAASFSPMGHIHHDNGSVVIGGGGRWLITDPGYQQYLVTREREFTIGPRAHNAPLVNGRHQTAKRIGRPRIDDLGSGTWRMRIDLSACYPEEAGARRVERCVWLLSRSAVVVCDRFDLERRDGLAYHWHGHAEAAWWIADGEAGLWCDGQPLRLSSPQVPLGEAMLDRLPGSRGQLTLSVPLPPQTQVWWLFSREPGRLRCNGQLAWLGDLRLDPD